MHLLLPSASDSAPALGKEGFPAVEMVLMPLVSAELHYLPDTVRSLHTRCV